MRHMMILISMFIATAGQAVTRDDFAYGYSLDVDGDGAIYSLNLNEEIYKGMVNEDRRDIRIFNSLGQPVPHYLRRVEKKQIQQVPRVSPPFFPLYATGSGENHLAPEVHITTNSQGTIIDINNGKVLPEFRVLKGYVVDLSALETPPDSLQFAWPQQESNFVSVISIQASDDLTHWRPLIDRATLSYLRYGQHTLLKNEIVLPPRKAKYLRIGWQGTTPLEISSLSAGFPESYQLQARQWSDILPDRFDDKTQTYYFNTRSMLPIDRINVGLPQRNTLINVIVESAHSENGPWYNRYQGLLYDLQQEGERIVNSAIPQRVNAHNFWRVQVLGEVSHLGGDLVLKLGWIPEQLLFVAQGESPFTLAYGSGRVEPVSAPLSRLLSEQNIRQQSGLIKVAHLGSRIKLGDESRLGPKPRPIDWKHYILWSVLVLGVILLAVMAMRLYRQMDQDTPKE